MLSSGMMLSSSSVLSSIMCLLDSLMLFCGLMLSSSLLLSSIVEQDLQLWLICFALVFKPVFGGAGLVVWACVVFFLVA